MDLMNSITITCLNYYGKKKEKGMKLKISACLLGILKLSVQKLFSC